MLSGVFAVLLVGALAGSVGTKSGRDCSGTPCYRSYSRDYDGGCGRRDGYGGCGGYVALVTGPMATTMPVAGPAADPAWFLRNSRWPRRLTGWWSAGATYDWSPFPQEIG
jgi:hypothetical protein